MNISACPSEPTDADTDPLGQDRLQWPDNSVSLMNTLLLTRSEIASLLDVAALTRQLRAGFIWYSQNRTDRAKRVGASLPGPGTATVLFPGTALELPIYTVKVHAKFPDQEPAIRGVLCLHSAASGDLLAVMDSTLLTAVRTGLSGALAADVLARSDADSVAVIGAGVQGRQQLVSLAAMRPLRHVWAYDITPAAAALFAQQMTEALGVPVRVMRSVASAVRDARIVLAATWSRSPLIESGMLAPGTHVTTLGADEPGKVEVSQAVIRSSAFFCDDGELAVEMGALAGAGLSHDHVAAELGEVLAATHPGRTAGEQITVYGGVGLAFQDAICAGAIYQAAINTGIGSPINFLS